jgi:hypothetical protein
VVDFLVSKLLLCRIVNRQEKADIPLAPKESGNRPPCRFFAGGLPYLDLSYAPPFTGMRDPMVIAGRMAQIDGRIETGLLQPRMIAGTMR